MRGPAVDLLGEFLVERSYDVIPSGDDGSHHRAIDDERGDHDNDGPGGRRFA